MLIERAKNRKINEGTFKERHHIIPRCLKGTDDPSNLVDLYPEEHFLAHQLLVKIHPNNVRVIKAATMMCVNGKHQQRMNNKIYGWLRKRLSDGMSQLQMGSKNTQFGTCWISNIEVRQCIKISNEFLDEYLTKGWIKKRIINWNTYNIYSRKRKCPVCNKEYEGKPNTCSLSCGQRFYRENNPKVFGKGKLETILEDYKKGYSIYRCLKNAGLDGTGKNHTKLKEIIKKLELVGDKSIGTDTTL